MTVFRLLIAALMALVAFASACGAAETEPGTIFTLWPLVDYRTSPAEGFKNLSLLGPLIKIESKGDERTTALRPLFYREDHLGDQATSTWFLYPAAYFDTTPAADTYEVLQLFRVNNYRKDEPAKERTTTLFPFYIAGHSPEHGDYRSVFPFYGDIYGRFWRDEYHYLMFPLYGSTVNKGTTTRHYLWPIFSTTSGEKEGGFEAFPLYGQSHKEGVYSKRYFLWPIFTWWKTGLNTDNPKEETTAWPLYGSVESPKMSKRSYLWPFFGYTEQREKKYRETDWFWPFIVTIRGEKREENRFLPIYSSDKFEDGERHWYLWPLYRHEVMSSKDFERESDRILFFLYRSSRETWPKDGSVRISRAAWPLFVYQQRPSGISSFSFPAPVESVLFEKEGIEKDWAPLWRIFQYRWDEDGNSAATFLWNLYWHEKRGEDLAYELFPLVSYRGLKNSSEFKLLKGLISLKSSDQERQLCLFWLPFGPKWGGK
ncbi:MAG TPA: hypothetical protein VJ550_07660 [Geomonas sp.]|nr:hypothetical protein [Geomonas sp.]